MSRSIERLQATISGNSTSKPNRFFDDIKQKDITQSDIKVEQIYVNSLFPMEEHTFCVIKDSDNYRSVLNSVRNNGILSPLLVRAKDGEWEKYEIIAGHRRCEIAKDLGIEKVPCIVLNISKPMAKCLMIESNFQRDVWTPGETARACATYIESLKETAQENGTQIDEKEVGRIRDKAAKVFAERGIKGKMFYNYAKIGKDLKRTLHDLMDTQQIAVMAGYQLSFLSIEDQYLIEQILTANPKCVLKEDTAKELRKYTEETRDAGTRPTKDAIEELLGLKSPRSKAKLPKITITLPQEFDNKKLAASYRKHKNDPELLNRIAELTHEVIISYLEEHTK